MGALKWLVLLLLWMLLVNGYFNRRTINDMKELRKVSEALIDVQRTVIDKQKSIIDNNLKHCSQYTQNVMRNIFDSFGLVGQQYCQYLYYDSEKNNGESSVPFEYVGFGIPASCLFSGSAYTNMITESTLQILKENELFSEGTGKYWDWYNKSGYTYTGYYNK